MHITFSHSALPNGLTVLTAPLEQTEAVTMMITAQVGRRFEADRVAGISHFLEHMFFKGTKRRPTPLKISQELDALGAHFNAFTGEERTSYYVQVAAGKFAQGWDVLADMLLYGQINQAELERERGVILEELKMYRDLPQYVAEEKAQGLVFNGNPLGEPIVGDEKTIAAVTPQDFEDYKHQYYGAENLIITVAGKLPSNVDRFISDSFSKRTKGEQDQYEAFKSTQTRAAFKIVDKPTDQTHFVIGWPALAYTDEKRWALGLGVQILGGMMSSRLFTEIREKRGLAYYVRAGQQSYHETGLASISAGVTQAKADEAVELCLTEARKLATQALDDEELSRARDNLIGSLYLGLEDSYSIADYLTGQIIYRDKILQPDEIVAKIKAVTPEDIRRVLAEVFEPTRANLGIVGQLANKQRTKLEKLFSSAGVASRLKTKR